jgi:hypothetical protein
MVVDHVNISEIYGESGAVIVTEPKAFFNWEKSRLTTYALYHGDQSITKINDIDGIRGKKKWSLKGKKKWKIIQKICTVRLKFADGTACVTMLENRDNYLQQPVEYYTTNIDGREWTTGWEVES